MRNAVVMDQQYLFGTDDEIPKREQRIIVAFKGDTDTIRDEFPPIGRL